MILSKKAKAVLKLFVISCICFCLGCITSLYAQNGSISQLPSCKCKPSPPGSTTTCVKGQIAVCVVRDGICSGSCVTVDNNLTPRSYFLDFCEKAFGIKYSPSDLVNRRDEVRQIISSVLGSNNRDVMSFFNYRGNRIEYSITIPNEGVLKLELFLRSI